MNNKKIILSILSIIIIFIIIERVSLKKTIPQKEQIKKPIGVSTQLASESKIIFQKNDYPAIVVGDQEIRITAKSAGTIVVAPGNISSSISAGALLAKIDDTGSLNAGDEGLKSLQIKQTKISIEQAKKSYGLAKDNYNDLKKTASASEFEIDSAKTQRDLAKLQYENASLGLAGALDNHLITSPITGIITDKAVSIGDSVSIGQLLATVSKSANLKIQFYVDASEQITLKRGQEISAINGNGNSISLLIRNISISADSATKRFLIEAYPKKQVPVGLFSGTVLNISIEKAILPQVTENLILPLSAISIGQNESYIFTLNDGIVKKELVTVMKVNGEIAEIASSLSPDARIITTGNKLVHDGETVTVQN